MPKQISLGVITGVHGVRGEVLIKSFTGAPLDIASYGPLRDVSGTRQFEISTARLAKKGVVARLKGIKDRDGAQALKGVELFISSDRLPATDDADEFYYTDLIGLDVQLVDGQSFGSVIAAHNFGAGDLIEIRLQGSKKTELFPFTKQTVPEIDLKAGFLTFVPPEIIESENK